MRAIAPGKSTVTPVGGRTPNCAHLVALDERDPGAERRRFARGHEARRTRADDKQVVALSVRSIWPRLPGGHDRRTDSAARLTTLP
jgi:hypothetical protein